MTEAICHQERHFMPAEMFLHSARHFVRKVHSDEVPRWPDLMAAASLLALSVEALVNSIGPHLVADFVDFESASPVAKLRIIFEHIGIKFDKSVPPMSEVCSLLKLRNKMAHPKYKKLRFSSERLSLEEARKFLRDESKTLHDLEKLISPESVERWYSAIAQVTCEITDHLPPEVSHGHFHAWLEVHEASSLNEILR